MEAEENALLLVFTDQTEQKKRLKGEVNEIRYGQYSTPFLSKEPKSWNPLNLPKDLGLNFTF